MTTSELEKLVAENFAPPSYSLLYEVRDGTGYQTAGRQCDMMAFGTWPSRGLEIIGFEFKTSRSDWIRELKTPAKAEAFFSYCDRWYVAAPEGVVVKAELPVGWGLIEVKANKEGSWKLKFTVPCEPRKAEPINRLFLMSIIRNISKNYVPQNRVKELADMTVKIAVDTAIENTKYENQRHVRDLEKLQSAINEFETASGIQITEWGDMGRVGNMVKLIRDYGTNALKEQLGYSINRLRACADDMEKAIKDFNEKGEINAK